MNIAIIGYGKMGKEIEQVLLHRGHTVGAIIDIDSQDRFTAEHLKTIDVAIEFTSPQTAFGNIIKCLELGIPVVCGTTAWLDHYQEAVAVCKERNGAFFYSSNYSIGVNLFIKLNRYLAKLMNPFTAYDVTEEEVHHTQKKDAPSGTAITIAENILQELDRKKRWVLGATTVPEELEIVAIRRSVVPGTHTVTWESEEDQLRLEHTAKGRKGLATGAVLAAEFLYGKKGIYTMDDLLRLD